MPFWADIAAALGREANELEVELGDRVVEDSLNGEELRTVLLCESPHSDEISHGHPLAGHSGRRITEAFSCYHPDFGALSEPIGCLLRQLHDGETIEQLSATALNSLNSLGLMNVSRLPLQGSAYCLDVRVSYSDLLCYFESIKMTLENSNKNIAQGVRYLRSLEDGLPSLQVYEALRDDLLCRLQQFQGQDVAVIPCGKVASVFFYWATLEPNDDEIPNDFVPHPSSPWWKRRRSKVQRLVARIRGRATA